MVDEWNGLNNHVLSAESMGSFIRRLDTFMNEDDRWNLELVTWLWVVDYECKYMLIMNTKQFCPTRTR